MVEISPAIKTNEAKGANTNGVCTATANGANSSGERPVEVDMVLVERARKLIKAEFERNGEKFALKHYEGILDKENPLICWRYLVHCNLKLRDAVELMRQALFWRHENKLDQPTKYNIKELWHFAPFSFTGSDKDGVDVLYIMGKNYRKPAHSFKMVVREFISRMLLGYDKEHEKDMKQWVMVFDVSETGFRNIDLDLMSWLVSIRDFAPSRTNRILVTGIPFIVRPLVRLIISWLPENFRKLVQCGTEEELIKPFIELSSMPVEIGDKNRDLSYRLAPPNTLWMAEMPQFDDPSKRKALEDSIGFNVSAELREKLRNLQMEREREYEKAKSNQ